MTGSRMQQVTPMNTKTRLGNAERLGRWLGGLWLGSRVPVCQHPVQQPLIGFICNIRGVNGVEICLIPMKSSPIRDSKSAPTVDSV